MIARVACRPRALGPLSQHPATLQRATDRSCINATTAICVAQLGALITKSCYKALPSLLNNGCRIIPLRRLQDWLLGSVTLFVYPSCPTASRLFLSYPLKLPPLFLLHPDFEIENYPDLSTLWLLENMAKLWYTPRSIPRNTTSKWKMT